MIIEVLRAFAAVYLVAMMFSMGLELGREPSEDKAAKRRKRRLVLRALVINLVLLPLLAVMLTRAIHASGAVAIAFLLLAASPGGRFAPHLSKLAGAQLGVSVEIALFLGKLVTFTAPPTAAWLLHEHRVELHELRLIGQLVLLQLLPYLLGRQVSRRWPALGRRLDRPFAIAMWVGLVALFVLAIASQELRGIASLAGDRGWWAVLAFAVLALGLGWLLGGPAPETRRAFAISVNARNLPLAFVIAGLAVPDRKVQLAVFAVWLLFMLFDLGFAKLVSARRRAPTEMMPTPA